MVRHWESWGRVGLRGGEGIGVEGTGIRVRVRVRRVCTYIRTACTYMRVWGRTRLGYGTTELLGYWATGLLLLRTCERGVATGTCVHACGWGGVGTLEVGLNLQLRWC